MKKKAAALLPPAIREPLAAAVIAAVDQSKATVEIQGDLWPEAAKQVLPAFLEALERAGQKVPPVPTNAERAIARRLGNMAPLDAVMEALGIDFAEPALLAWPKLLRPKLKEALGRLPKSSGVPAQVCDRVLAAVDTTLEERNLAILPASLRAELSKKIIALFRSPKAASRLADLTYDPARADEVLRAINGLSAVNWTDEILDAPVAARPYSPKARFELGDGVSHPTFGKGVVTEAQPQHVVVRFAAETKRLVHARD